MKKLIQFFCMALFGLISVQAVAQQDTTDVTIRQLNTYDNLESAPTAAALIDSLQASPLNGATVRFTAVVVSYPRSSGLATPNDTDNDGTIDDIGRIHVFVTDTNAVSQGRDGMSIQLVESDWELLEGFNRGDVIEVIGRYAFFNAETQVAADGVTLIGNVNSDLPEYADLLNPITVTVDELNTYNQGDDTHQVNKANYGKYNGTYVRIENAVVSNVSLGDRPDWAVSNNGSRIYTYDTSLRYRNDRVDYLPEFNYRHGADPEFIPPAPGSIVNISGFVGFAGGGDDPDGNVAADQIAFNIRPFEDGVLWTGGQRFEDGDEIPGLGTLSWPNDLEVVGAPPVFSNVSQSDSAVTSTDAVTISATVVAAEAPATVVSVDLVYSDGATTDTVAMTANGDVYSFTLPTFDNFTPVSFYFIAEDSDGLIGRDPIAGEYGFFVQDAAINAVSLIQETADGQPGSSPLEGAGVLDMDLTGTIVSDNNDGVIIIQDAAAPWSGVFLEKTTATQALTRGDVITITAAEVFEAPIASNSQTLTQLINLSFTTTGTATVDDVVPTLTTDQVVAETVSGQLEPYEGMLVKFVDAQVTERGRFGEYTLKNVNADSTDGAQFNEDIRSSNFIGDVNVDGDFNTWVRLNKTMTAYAVVANSFGAPKFHPRDAADLRPADGNAFTPVLDFNLGAPADSAEVEVVSDINVTWSASEDFDGDDVTYEWVLYTAADTTAIVTVPSNNSSADPNVTLPYATVDDLLGSNGVAVGESASFVWNVRVSDGLDTLDVTDGDAPIFRYLTLQRGLQTSNEDDSGIPVTYGLEQNYPNPFNPTTNIKFQLPEAAEVQLNVYDMLGRRVQTVVSERFTAGTHTVSFDASRLASGMYIYRIQAGNFVSTRKMMLIK